MGLMKNLCLEGAWTSGTMQSHKATRPMSSAKLGKDELLSKLAEWNIQTETLEHPQVFTVEQALPHLENTQGKFAKNLFLKDKKKRLYLFCAPHDADVKLNDLAKMVGAAGGLRFADSTVLEDKLGIQEGSVTVFGIINDTDNKVRLVLDQRLLDETYTKLWFHPMVNSATTSISPTDLKSFIDKTNHEPLIVNIS
uniref:PrdX deacylase domain-containing protein 1 n=2 Tax=Crassostrea virginica TaxID=6565 RepID=A0A8B8DV77_CRAVI|nr:prolyl-tRNA synthetase associated domain-containing protein 1-like isoform X1 [Crassostrea virginica]